MDVVKDEQLARETREAIAKETSISDDGHRVQVAALNGVVTLTGHVPSAGERMTIGDKAAAVAGFGKVNNQIQAPDED